MEGQSFAPGEEGIFRAGSQQTIGTTNTSFDDFDDDDDDDAINNDYDGSSNLRLSSSLNSLSYGVVNSCTLHDRRTMNAIVSASTTRHRTSKRCLDVVPTEDSIVKVNQEWNLMSTTPNYIGFHSSSQSLSMDMISSLTLPPSDKRRKSLGGGGVGGGVGGMNETHVVYNNNEQRNEKECFPTTFKKTNSKKNCSYPQRRQSIVSASPPGIGTTGTISTTTESTSGTGSNLKKTNSRKNCLRPQRQQSSNFAGTNHTFVNDTNHGREYFATRTFKTNSRKNCLLPHRRQSVVDTIAATVLNSTAAATTDIGTGTGSGTADAGALKKMIDHQNNDSSPPSLQIDTNTLPITTNPSSTAGVVMPRSILRNSKIKKDENSNKKRMALLRTERPLSDDDTDLMEGTACTKLYRRGKK